MLGLGGPGIRIKTLWLQWNASRCLKIKALSLMTRHTTACVYWSAHFCGKMFKHLAVAVKIVLNVFDLTMIFTSLASSGQFLQHWLFAVRDGVTWFRCYDYSSCPHCYLVVGDGRSVSICWADIVWFTLAVSCLPTVWLTDSDLPSSDLYHFLLRQQYGVCLLFAVCCVWYFFCLSVASSEASCCLKEWKRCIVTHIITGCQHLYWLKNSTVLFCSFISESPNI